MFRRPPKNHFEEKEMYKQEESPLLSNYKYGKTSSEESPSRIFDSPLPSTREDKRDTKALPLSHSLNTRSSEEAPETTLGEGVSFRGELSFERFLRIDGSFEGELLSKGKVVIGPKGKVKANLNLKKAVIEGKVEGNVKVEESLELRGNASISGDIEAKFLSVDEGVKIIGQVIVTGAEKEESSTE